MPGMRPSGICNGQQCYTAGDIAQINAEIADSQASISNLQATYQDQCNTAGATLNEITDEQQHLSDLQSELQSANNNACPQ